MKFSKKLFVVLGLVALLTAVFATTAFAADRRVVRYASVVKVKVMANQPATFRLLGSFTCDKVQINSSVSGKVITINAFDTKVKYTGMGCENDLNFSRDVTVGVLVPGIYTIVINPDQNGKGAKVIKSFIAPMLPTPQPTAAPAQ